MCMQHACIGQRNSSPFSVHTSRGFPALPSRSRYTCTTPCANYLSDHCVRSTVMGVRVREHARDNAISLAVHLYAQACILGAISLRLVYWCRAVARRIESCRAFARYIARQLHAGRQQQQQQQQQQQLQHLLRQVLAHHVSCSDAYSRGAHSICGAPSIHCQPAL